MDIPAHIDAAIQQIGVVPTKPIRRIYVSPVPPAPPVWLPKHLGDTPPF